MCGGQLVTKAVPANYFGFYMNDKLLIDNILCTDKTNFLVDSVNNTYLVESAGENFLKNNFFKKMQPLLDQKKRTDISKRSNVVLTTNSPKDYNIFTNLRRKIVDRTNNTLTQHIDLDDDNRIVKKNMGKNTPIRVLKKPIVDFFFKTVDSIEDINLISLRFNDKIPTITNKPIKPTTYLTFKQKRYNQRTSIGKKSNTFFNKDTNKKQVYSGNPFLKDLSIIEENFGNPTRQYRLVKKAKNRLDTTRVAN